MLRLVRAVALVILIALALANLFAMVASLEPPGSYDKDFSQEYLLARALWDGTDTNLPIRDLAARYATVTSYLDKPNPTPHPPTAGLLALPLAALDYVSAVRAWFGFQLSSLVASVWLLARANHLPPRPPAAVPAAAGALLSSRWPAVLIASLCLIGWPPVGLDLGMGQLSLPLLGLLAAAQLALGAERRRLAGVLLGLSLLLKPLAWPWLLVLVRRRQWATVSTTLGSLSLGYLAVALREGPQRLAAYFLDVGPALNAGFVHEPTNLSLWTLGLRLLPTAPGLATLLSAAVVALVLGLVWLAAGPRRPLGAALGVATMAAILVSPVSWYFYLVLLLLPAAYVLGQLHLSPQPAPAATLASVLLLVYVPAWLPAARLSSVGVALPVYLVALLPTAGLLGLALALPGAAQCEPPARLSRPKTWSQRLQ